MAVDTTKSTITCGCGKVFQTLRDNDGDTPNWDEIKTSKAYKAHYDKCTLSNSKGDKLIVSTVLEGEII